MRALFYWTALVSLCLPGVAADAKHAPLPEKLVAAHTAFIQNESGEVGFADAVFAQLQEWGRWRVVTNRADADVVISLDHKDVFIHNFFSLTVSDRQSGDLLWVRKKDVAIRIWGNLTKKLMADLRKRLPA